MNRREFLASAGYFSILSGLSDLSGLGSAAFAQAAPLDRKLLINLFLDGGPDFRHLIVPAYDPTPDSFGYKYWRHRARSHQILETNTNRWRTRWEEDYYPITVGGQNWGNGLIDSGGLNSNVTFGIWREAGWLIDMFVQGNVALVFNAVGGTNRAHDLSSLMLNQGNLNTTINNSDYSGWGGRLARSANGNTISVTSSPSAFCFGPIGAAPNYDVAGISNLDLISVENAREIGLFDYDLNDNQFYHTAQKMSRATKSYYAALSQEDIPQVYEKFMDHESKLREFGVAIRSRLESVSIPENVRALYEGVIGSGGVINPDPNNISQPRRVLRSSGFGRQIRNVYDVISSNDLLNSNVISMRYGGWDTHSGQRQTSQAILDDPNNPNQNRGIESNFKDIFGGQFGSVVSDPTALHGGFSALWNSLSIFDRDNIAITMAGEFGRQIRANGDAGTDHGSGNLMLVISQQLSGGIYGEMFPDDEVDKYDNDSLNTPDIDPRTEIDQIFSAVSDWVAPNSGSSVFPRMNNVGNPQAGEDQIPSLEAGVSFENLFSDI